MSCTVYVCGRTSEVIVWEDATEGVTARVTPETIYHDLTKEYTACCDGFLLAGQDKDESTAKRSLLEAIRLFLEDHADPKTRTFSFDDGLSSPEWEKSSISRDEAIRRVSRWEFYGAHIVRVQITP